MTDLQENDVQYFEHKLKCMKEKHKWLWEEYGSELCVEDMLSKERKLERQIEILKGNINDTNAG